MVFNEKQSDGVAKALDNVWTAAGIALMVGTIVEQRLSTFAILGLTAVGIVCFYIALRLRTTVPSKETQNDNQ